MGNQSGSSIVPWIGSGYLSFGDKSTTASLLATNASVWFTLNRSSQLVDDNRCFYSAPKPPAESLWVKITNSPFGELSIWRVHCSFFLSHSRKNRSGM